MKKICILFSLLLMIFGCFSGCCGGNQYGIKNVIIIIGDGMGFNHLTNAKTYFDIENFIFDDDLFAEVMTRSLNHETTDSAAAATALATGNKVDNYEVGLHRPYGEEEWTEYQNIMEFARQYHKKTGIFTSDSLVGATPAAFSSHVFGRDDTHEIIYDQVNSDIDLFVAATCTEYYDHLDLFEAHNYALIDDLDGLKNLNKKQKGVAIFESLNSYYNEELENVTNFNTALSYTLDYLNKGKNGFCLMIENGYIDKYSHNNKLYDAMCEVRMFADTIKLVYDFCEQNKDTAVFITADHETGGLQLAKDKQSMDNSLFTKGSHSAANVPLYTKNVPFDKKAVIDNTDINAMMKALIAGTDYGKKAA